MKKKTILKICLSVFSIVSFFFSIYAIINAIKHISIFNGIAKYEFSYRIAIFYEIKRIVFFSFCCISNILLFLIVNIKDLQFLTSSLIKTIKEHHASTAEQRKAKKQAKLQAEIAEKQAKLDEMKKDITE